MNLNDNELKRLHDVEIDILKDFLKVCKKLKLQYYFVGGSALGAVRHEGFIPWDDDIDICLPRKDYNKFIKEGQKYLSNNLFIQTFNTDSKYKRHFAKIRNTETTFIEESVKDVDMNQGVFMDIFPLDGVGNTIEEAKKNYHKYRVLNEIYIFKTEGFNTKGLKNKIRFLYYFVKSLPYKDLTKLRNKIENLFCEKDYDKSKFVCSVYGFYGEKEIMPKKWFEKGKQVNFENLKVIVPLDVDKFLKQLYGDYMKLPPKEKRVAPHCERLDLDKSYKFYIK